MEAVARVAIRDPGRGVRVDAAPALAGVDVVILDMVGDRAACSQTTDRGGEAGGDWKQWAAYLSGDQARRGGRPSIGSLNGAWYLSLSK